MSAPRLCGDCAHPVGNHSHLMPHPCGVDRCNCPAYEREPINLSNQEGTK